MKNTRLFYTIFITINKRIENIYKYFSQKQNIVEQ